MWRTREIVRGRGGDRKREEKGWRKRVVQETSFFLEPGIVSLYGQTSFNLPLDYLYLSSSFNSQGKSKGPASSWISHCY